MTSKRGLKLLMSLSLICLSFNLCGSCASTALTSPTSSSETILKDTSAEVHAADCKALKPTAAPDVAKARLVAMAQKPGESNENYAARLTPDQHALLAWMNHDSKEAENFLTYCKP